MSRVERSPEVEANLRELRAMGDVGIDVSEMPEATDWSKAKRGLWHRVKRDDLIVMLEPKVMAWFRTHRREGEELNDTVNRVLREHVAADDRHAA